MDGNGRWARSRGASVAYGHREGVEAVQRCVRAAIKQGVQFLTLYAFSSENWKRSEEEIGNLTALLRFYLRHKLSELHEQNVKLQIIGEPERFGKTLNKELQEAQDKTANNKVLTLTLALSYGGRAELVKATKLLIEEVVKGQLSLDDINEQHLSNCLQTASIPDPDILVRTSGEHRLSNFLLWQSAYSELLFLDVLWPDFQENHFSEIIDHYGRRNRRFGGRPR
ncbi:di-trans,poly-cis-decaprenylcistransferase [Aristophania vespae]|uniref:Isoprenyl transferase n=2 Tax=Aristophania vespae TaxID=2697033 RepID=A0A6P1NND6_9PROT|nr:polyprenyl diphosphate synthase [Aristophania vespae]QHI96361.1 di-trans,poly-cis-decaprenylcistransferase [Aristophania vespae]